MLDSFVISLGYRVKPECAHKKAAAFARGGRK
jgi:hypothetical protein